MTADELPKLQVNTSYWNVYTRKYEDNSYSIKSVKAREIAIAERLKNVKEECDNGIKEEASEMLNDLILELTRRNETKRIIIN